MKTRYIFLTILAATLTVSCDKFLDTSLDLNASGETVETNRGTIWSFANAFYSPIIYGYSVIDGNLFAAASDEAQQTAASSNALYFNKGMLNESLNPLWTYYNNCYEGIRAANFFLDYVADGKGIALLEKNRNLITDAASYARDVRSLNFYIAEAHVARAYYYAELIKMYGGVPIVEKTQQQSGGAFVERSSYEACVEYIVSEIDNWKDQLALNWNDDNTREGRFTLGAALAIKARVLLYAASPLHNPSGDRAKWVRAAEAAKDILVNPNLSYTLAGDYGSYFQGGNSLSSKETIYVVRRAANNTMETNNYPIATSGGKSGVCPTENLVSAYEWIGTPDPENPYANRDPRLAASIVTNGREHLERPRDRPGRRRDRRPGPRQRQPDRLLPEEVPHRRAEPHPGPDRAAQLGRLPLRGGPPELRRGRERGLGPVHGARRLPDQRRQGPAGGP